MLKSQSLNIYFKLDSFFMPNSKKKIFSLEGRRGRHTQMNRFQTKVLSAQNRLDRSGMVAWLELVEAILCGCPNLAMPPY